MEFFSSTNLDTKDNGLVGVSKDRVRKEGREGEREEETSCSVFGVHLLFH